MLRRIYLFVAIVPLLFLYASPCPAVAQDNVVSSYICYNTGPLYAEVNSCTMQDTPMVGYIATDILGECALGQQPAAFADASLDCDNFYTITSSGFPTVNYVLDPYGCGVFLGQVNATSGVQFPGGEIIYTGSAFEDCNYVGDNSDGGVFLASPC
jgi:hypothetical protein